jgi:uncharacterized protein YcaQ
MQVVRDLGCLQLDPINVVARSHMLVLWSRIGAFDPAELEVLRWEDRRLFEYWAHAASIVPTDDYPIHSQLMRTYPGGDLPRRQRMRAWLKENEALRRHVVNEVRRRGPLPARELEDRSEAPWRSTGWTNERNVDRMLDCLQVQGKIMVAGRTGAGKVWDLADRWLPEWTPRERLQEREVVRRAAERSLLALGVARPRDIARHFIVGRYPGLAGALKRFEREGRVLPVKVEADGKIWPGRWYVHSDDLPLVDALSGDQWGARTTLLSPFDNLIIDRDRTELLFGFNFRMEIYVPKSKRRYGYYVLPILHGDRLIGRVDPMMDRRSGRLVVNAVHAEPDAPSTLSTARAVARAIEELAQFLQATEIEYATVPNAWSRALRS